MRAGGRETGSKRVRYLVGTVAGCLLATGTAASGTTFSLQEALEVTYQTNPQLAQARASVEALDQGVAQANANWLPSVNASGTYGAEHGVVQGFASPFDSRPLTAQLGVTQQIFRGGRTYAEVGRAVAQVRAGRAALQATEQGVLLNAVTAYMDVVRDTETVRLNGENVRTLETALADVNTEKAAGEVTKTDVLQAEARLARARSDSALAEMQLETDRAAFENVIGRPPETLEALPALPPLPASKTAALDSALRFNPSLVQAKANAKAADFDVADAVGVLLPQVSVTGQYQYLKDVAGTNIFATRNPQTVLSVIGQVTVPIYQGGGEEATVRRAKDTAHQAELAIVSADRDVRQGLNSASQSLRSAELGVSANQAQEAADRGAIEGVKQEQQAGERSVIDVLNAQEELFIAQVSLIAAQHDTVVSAYRTLSATGKLTAQSLALHVPLYDPFRHFDENANAWFGFGD